MHLMIRCVLVLAVINALYGNNRSLFCELDGTHTRRAWRGVERSEWWEGVKNKALSVL